MFTCVWCLCDHVYCVCTCLVYDAVTVCPPPTPASPTHCFLQQWRLHIPSCYSTGPRGPVTPQPPSHFRPAVPSRSLGGMTGRLALLAGDTLCSGELWAVLVEPGKASLLVALSTSCSVLPSTQKGLLMSYVPKLWVLLSFIGNGIGILVSSPTYCFFPETSGGRGPQNCLHARS